MLSDPIRRTAPRWAIRKREQKKSPFPMKKKKNKTIQNKTDVRERNIKYGRTYAKQHARHSALSSNVCFSGNKNHGPLGRAEACDDHDAECPVGRIIITEKSKHVTRSVFLRLCVWSTCECVCACMRRVTESVHTGCNYSKRSARGSGFLACFSPPIDVVQVRGAQRFSFGFGNDYLRAGHRT